MTTAPNAIELAGWIEAEIERHRDPARAAAEKRYLKSELEFVGAGTEAVRNAVKAALKAAGRLDRATVLALVEALWAKPVHELRAAAFEALHANVKLLEREDVNLVERLMRETRNWAFVDALSVHIAGNLVVRFPDLDGVLDRWAADGDFWLRRAAMLALLEPLRRGGGDFERFAAYADGMLEEKEFFIRKAIGWVLREVAKKRPELVDSWLAPRIGRTSGVTVREAVRYLSAERREALMAAYRAIRGGARAEGRSER